MMKILIYSEDRLRATDGNIYQGTFNILRKKYPTASIDYIKYEDFELVGRDYFQPQMQYDLVVLAGTPWIWDQFYLSAKYKNWLTLKATHPEAKFIMMGIGSCLNLQDIDTHLVRQPKDIPFLKELTKGCTVIVRDFLAHEILNYGEVDNILLPCPSFWVDMPEQKKIGNALVWFDPLMGISSAAWENNFSLLAYETRFLEFYKKYKPDVYCVYEKEKASAIAIGLPEPMLLGNIKESHNHLAGRENVLSGRVHCAIPAFVAGAKVDLVATDSRAATYYEFIDAIEYNKPGYLSTYLHILERI